MDNNEPIMVSIKCLVYNHAPYLRQCLDGFVMQKTNFRFEAIVHDDCSTDGSQEIIKEYAAKYPDIIKPIYETENQYSKHDGSLRRAIDPHLTGKYIAFCEGDDYWIDPNKLQMQVDYMEEHSECSLCFHNYYIQKGNLKTPAHNYVSESYTKNEIFFYYPFHTSTILIKKEVVLSEIYRNGPIVLNEDTKLFLASTYFGKNHGFSRIMSCYRASAGVTKTLLEKKIPYHLKSNIVVLASYYKIKGWERHFIPKLILISSYQFSNKNFKLFLKTCFISLHYSPYYTLVGIKKVTIVILQKIRKYLLLHPLFNPQK